MKLEVETVIKTGRQIVQKQQTENPKAMDEQLTALKLLYNDLGAQVTSFLELFSMKRSLCWIVSRTHILWHHFKQLFFFNIHSLSR